MNSAVIFDMDGTLFQTNLILEPALEATFEQLRQKGQWTGTTPIEKYRDIMGVPLPVVWETLCPEHSPQIREQSNLLFQLALIEQIKMGKGALYEGVKSTLTKLAQTQPLFIASNGQNDYLQAIAETYNLTKWIKGIYSIDLITSGNKSELVATVLKENDILNGFVVGDRSSDIQAALDNDLLSIGVRFDFAQEKELEKAEYVVNQFADILAIIESV
ncbi:HAD hydrolase-like protein [Caryophanon tenue]|uniref:Nucleosidase n=1 Tax=Caryophanon tenue TaxID=33978 RepID=A0A1C0YCL3_9BACL|nr:HAD hydrolase-like protein [Caryophanon tenue]OCS84917.1 nucleosidase [Caryophanon tenue]